MDDVGLCLYCVFLRLFNFITEVFGILFHARQRIRLRGKGYGFEELRGCRRLRIFFNRDKKMPAVFDCILELFITDARGLCHLFQVGKAVFFLQSRFGVNVGIFKSSAAGLRTNDLLLHVGRGLLQLCTGCDLLQTVKHDCSCHRPLCGDIFARLFRGEPLRMTYDAGNGADGGRHAEPEADRERLCAGDNGINRHVSYAVCLICRTAIGGCNNAVMDEIIGDGLRAFLRGFCARDFERVLDVVFRKSHDGFTLADIIFRLIDDSADRLACVSLRPLFSEEIQPTQRLCHEAKIHHLNGRIDRASNQRIRACLIICIERIPIHILHCAIFGIALAGLRTTHALEHAFTHARTCSRSDELIARGICECCTRRSNDSRTRRHGPYCSHSESNACAAYAADQRSAARLDCCACCACYGRGCLRHDETVADAFADALQHLRAGRCHTSCNRRKRVIPEGWHFFLIFLDHLVEVCCTLEVVIICCAEEYLIHEIVKFEPLISEFEEMREGLHNPMRLTHGFDIMESKCRITRVHFRDIADLREFLPDGFHREVVLHQFPLFLCIVVYLERLLVGDIVVDKGIRGDSRICFNLAGLAQFLLVCHEVVDECFRAAQVLRKLASLVCTLFNLAADIGAQGTCRAVCYDAHRRQHKVRCRAAELVHGFLHIRSVHEFMTRFIGRHTFIE